MVEDRFLSRDVGDDDALMMNKIEFGERRCRLAEGENEEEEPDVTS